MRRVRITVAVLHCKPYLNHPMNYLCSLSLDLLLENTVSDLGAAGERMAQGFQLLEPWGILGFTNLAQSQKKTGLQRGTNQVGYHSDKHWRCWSTLRWSPGQFCQVIKEPWDTPQRATPKSCYSCKTKNLKILKNAQEYQKTTEQTSIKIQKFNNNKNHEKKHEKYLKTRKKN